MKSHENQHDDSFDESQLRAMYDLAHDPAPEAPEHERLGAVSAIDTSTPGRATRTT